MEKVITYSNTLKWHAGIAAVGKMLAAMIHYENVVYQEPLKRTSVLDSGAARHVNPGVIITDIENRTKLSSFTGEDVWIDDADYVKCIECTTALQLAPAACRRQ